MSDDLEIPFQMKVREPFKRLPSEWQNVAQPIPEPFFINNIEFTPLTEQTFMSDTGIVLSMSWNKNGAARWFCYLEYAMARGMTPELSLAIATAKNYAFIKSMDHS